MKTKILSILAIALILGACNNQENKFDDFGITGCYFPYQTPARSLILGDYPLGNNENDNNHRFEIGVTMAGVYENTLERKVYFELAPELLENVENVQALPQEYYTIETSSPVSIMAGDLKGRIAVQLKDAFFNDELSVAGDNNVNYVIPLVITDVVDLDTVLSGTPLVDSPDRANASDWSIAPQDFTFYGIKFINKYHAMYLRRGVDESTDESGTKVESVYHDAYIERDELIMVETAGNKTVELSNQVRRGSESSPGNVEYALVFNDSDVCEIVPLEGGKYDVSGTGKFVEDAEEWGDEKRDAIYLDYNYLDEDNNESHHVMDTLVVRDRNVVFEEFTIQLKE